MDPSTRALLIGRDVTNALIANHIPFDGDLAKRFGPDLQMSTGTFEALLNVIQDNINTDQDLMLAAQFRWKPIKGDPDSHESFSQYFLSKSINDLIICLDGVLSRSPYSV